MSSPESGARSSGATLTGGLAHGTKASTGVMRNGGCTNTATRTHSGSGTLPIGRNGRSAAMTAGCRVACSAAAPRLLASLFHVAPNERPDSSSTG